MHWPVRKQKQGIGLWEWYAGYPVKGPNFLRLGQYGIKREKPNSEISAIW